MTIANPPGVSDAAKTALDAVLAKHVDSTPAVSFGVTTKDGVIYTGYRGDRVYGQPEEGQVDESTTFQIYSMTKFVTSLAVLQQVEAGVLSYDDAAVVQKHAPELCKQKILVSYDKDTKHAEFKDLERPPTLRDLVTHTSGQMYFFFNPMLASYDADHGLLATFGAQTEQFAQPFLFSPGQKFAYGIGIDWAGIIVERATGMTLERYFREKIFDPLGISTDTTFVNRADVVARRQHTVHRLADGGVALGAPQRPLDEAMAGQLAGGAGLWSTPDDYLALIRGVLRSKQPGGIISPEGFELLFRDSLPEDGPASCCHQDLAAFFAMLDTSYAELNKPEAVGHSIACLVNKVDTPGRKAGSGAWGGAAKTQFCIDPATGVGFVAMTQIERPLSRGVVLSRAREPFFACWQEFESELYQHLA